MNFLFFLFFSRDENFSRAFNNERLGKPRGLHPEIAYFPPDNRSASVLQDMCIFIESCLPIDSFVQPVVEGDTSHVTA